MAQTPPKCWIGVVAREHALHGAAEGFVMFAHGKHTAVKQVQPGDWFAYYAPTQSMRGKDAVRRFVAIGVIAPGAPVEQQMSAESSGWQRPAHYLEAAEADIYPLLSQLDFIADQAHWGMYFRKSLFNISAIDFSRIADAMGVGASFNLGDNE